jgi:choline dehydrogenase-like flavoprotein
VAAGNDGWSYDDVLPDYRDMERYRGPASHFHGTSGELDVQRPKSGNPLSYALVRAGVEAGLSANEDFNGPTQDGIGRYDVNQHNGTRVSSARAFLHPVMGRANLLVHAKTLARRIVIENGRATGVELEHAGQRFVLRANAEIIACGGAINSPQLLMLSGIGPSAQLRRHTIDVVADLPGVGANLQDHASVYVAMENPSGEAYALSRKSFLQVIASPFQYLFNRTGMLASNVAEAGAFIRTSELVSRPDIQMTLLVGLKSTALTIPRQHGYMIIVQLLRPNSRGTVKLATSRPEDKPSIELNFGADDRDLRTLMQGIRAARKILAQPALAGMNGKELSPGSDVQSDEALEACVRRTVTTSYHPAGTCKMGPKVDPMAVLDNRLRVHGISGLRVVDTSMMPTIVSGNTSAPAMMIGARAARLILEDRVRPADGSSR